MEGMIKYMYLKECFEYHQEYKEKRTTYHWLTYKNQISND